MKNRYKFDADTNTIYDTKDYDSIPNVVVRLNAQDKVIRNLKQQLAEKDKEIEKLNLMIETLPNHDTEIEQQIRHQVCEEIRNYMTQDDCLTKEELIECLESFTAKQIFNLLDQIEKGESKW